MRAFLFSILFFLSGCASFGTKVDRATVATFKAGETTQQQVIAALGEPNSVEHLQNGETLIAYTYSRATVSPMVFVPLVGAFAEHNIATTGAFFTFDQAGKLKETRDSQTNTKGGIFH